MPAKHATIGPSSFSRVRQCPASLRFAAQFPNESNAAADEGTACHEAVERMLDGELIEPGFVAENGITLTVEHLAHVEDVFDWVADHEFDRIWNEVRVPVGAALGLNDPNIMWGTSDIVAIKGSALWVIDAKFGFVPVEVEKIDPETGEVTLNDQAMCYLVGALHEIAPKVPGDIEEVWIAVIQPRAGGPKVARVSWSQIAEFKKAAREAIMLALGDDAPFRPSESACRFCPASGSCRAQVTEEFELLDHVGDVDTLDDEALAAWLDKADHIVATIKAMQAQALARLAAGRKLPGWVREQGSGRARWIDEEEVVHEIEAAGLDLDQYAPRKPITQTALKKKLGKEWVEALIVRPPGEVKLVRAEEATNPLDPEFEVLEGDV